MSFDFVQTDIEGVFIVKPEVYEDERGFLLETYEKGSFQKVGIDTEFILEFYSKSEQDVLRGLHQQKEPYQQAKLVRCFQGKIFDVAIDVRLESNTFGEYVSTILSSENKHALYIPRGFLHGFVTLSDDAVVHYKVDNEYAPDNECGVIWNDPAIGIDWPVEDPIISEKDQGWPTLQESIYTKD